MEQEPEIGSFQPEVGSEQPDASIGSIIGTFRDKGIIGAIDDESMGPHTHLAFLLSLVFLLAIIIGIVQLAM